MRVCSAAHANAWVQGKAGLMQAGAAAAMQGSDERPLAPEMSRLLPPGWLPVAAPPPPRPPPRQRPQPAGPAPLPRSWTSRRPPAPPAAPAAAAPRPAAAGGARAAGEPAPPVGEQQGATRWATTASRAGSLALPRLAGLLGLRSAIQYWAHIKQVHRINEPTNPQPHTPALGRSRSLRSGPGPHRRQPAAPPLPPLPPPPPGWRRSGLQEGQGKQGGRHRSRPAAGLDSTQCLGMLRQRPPHPAQPNRGARCTRLRRTAPALAHPGRPGWAGPAAARRAARGCSRPAGGRRRTERWARRRCRGGTCGQVWWEGGEANLSALVVGHIGEGAGNGASMRSTGWPSPGVPCPPSPLLPPPSTAPVLPPQQEGRQAQRRQPHKQRA